MNLNQRRVPAALSHGQGPVFDSRRTTARRTLRGRAHAPRRLRPRGRSGLTLRRGAGRGLRHVLGPRSGRSAGTSRTAGRIDEQAYFELEFAVGFPAEEETLR